MSSTTNPPGAIHRRPDCVVIDTNIWRSELLLKTPLGVSFVYTLGRQQGRLGLPEVVERELKKQIVEAGLEAVEQNNKWSRIATTLTGSPFFPLSHSAGDFEQIVEKRLDELTPVLLRVPFTLEHARAALDMVNAKVPPNAKNQQFKDSAIWQAVLHLSQEYAVHLVTNDRAFLANREDPSQGLAANLQADCAAADARVGIYCDLGSCLQAVSGNRPPFDRDHLVPLIESFVMPRLQAEATRLRCELKEVLDTKIEAFWTQTANRVALDYTVALRFEPESPSQQEREAERTAIAHGSCYYDSTSDTVDEGFIQETRFLSRSSTGRSMHARSYDYENLSIPFPRPLPQE